MAPTTTHLLPSGIWIIVDGVEGCSLLFLFLLLIVVAAVVVFVVVPKKSGRKNDQYWILPGNDARFFGSTWIDRVVSVSTK